LWEDWGDVASRNHIMYGDIGTWFHRTLAGIRPDDGSNAFRSFTIAPTPVGDLTWVKAECTTMHGPIRSEWKREGGRFTLDVTVPFNTTATVVVPLPRPGATVTEGGRPAEQAPGLKVVRRDSVKTSRPRIAGTRGSRGDPV
jgi:alpha-L-rhamnosidase